MTFRYAYSKISDGNMSFRWGDPVSVPENRCKFLQRADIKIEDCVTVHTSSGVTCKKVTKDNTGQGMLDIADAIYADAMITDEKNLSLFLLVADCAATIFYDPKKEVLCLAHLNGMNPGIIDTVLESFKHQFGSLVTDLEVRVGPAIHKSSFVVPNPFQRESAEWAHYIANLDEQLTSIDMLGFLKDKMLEAGILDKNIDISDIDTFTSNKYFSHRRSVVTGEKEGRFAVVAKLV